MKIQLKAKKQKGFTIIELVVVILLLGILAATALPRFLDVTDEAHASVVEGVRGGLATGSALFRATWVATGQSTTAAVADYGLGTLFANSNGYPIGTAAGDPTVNTCVQAYDGLLQGGRPTAVAATVANGATAEARETAIETAATATTDVVAVLEQAADIEDSTSCSFYYVGQFKEGTSTANVSLPLISYDFTTGEISQTTLVLDDD